MDAVDGNMAKGDCLIGKFVNATGDDAEKSNCLVVVFVEVEVISVFFSGVFSLKTL